MTALVLGDFDAEASWRDPDLCTLPAVADLQARRIVAAMDELLFPMCGPDDLLVTRGAIDPAQKAYLGEQGFRFRAAVAPGATALPSETIAAALLRCDAAWLDDASGAGHQIHPFAVTPGISALSERHGLCFDGPPLDVVRRVNSKVYSTALRDRLGLDNPAVVVECATDLEQAGARMMKDGPLIIKDPFGVSGSGNLTLSSPAMLERIARHLARQERGGKRTQMLLEPLLDRARDFSCQLRISRDGELTVLSIQEMVNDQHAYSGSRTAPDELVDVLDARGYFEVAEGVGRLLHEAGYWGPVCLDSMVLGDGTVFPIVEINARMSMGTLNHLLDEHLPPAARIGWLSQLSLSLSGALRQEQLLEALAGENLLYRGEERGGIMPLAAGPLQANASAGAADGRHRARLYFKAIGGQQAAPEEHVAHLRRVLADLGGTVF